jgi:hypothetical protein
VAAGSSSLIYLALALVGGGAWNWLSWLWSVVCGLWCERPAREGGRGRRAHQGPGPPPPPGSAARGANQSHSREIQQQAVDLDEKVLGVADADGGAVVRGSGSSTQRASSWAGAAVKPLAGLRPVRGTRASGPNLSSPWTRWRRRARTKRPSGAPPIPSRVVAKGVQAAPTTAAAGGDGSPKGTQADVLLHRLHYALPGRDAVRGGEARCAARRAPQRSAGKGMGWRRLRCGPRPRHRRGGRPLAGARPSH